MSFFSLNILCESATFHSVKLPEYELNSELIDIQTHGSHYGRHKPSGSYLQTDNGGFPVMT